MRAGFAIAALLATCPAPSANAGPAKPWLASPNEVAGGPTGHYLIPNDIHKIKHVIIVIQENRSFGSYWGA